MTGTVAKIIKETNWAMVSLVVGLALSAVSAFASVSGDIRELKVQTAEVQKSADETASEVAKLRDLFIAKSFRETTSGRI